MGCHQSHRGTVGMPRWSEQTVISRMHYSTALQDLCSSHLETHCRGNCRKVLWLPEAIAQHLGRYPTFGHLNMHGSHPVLAFSLFWQWKDLNNGGVLRRVRLCSTYQSHLMVGFKETASFWVCLWDIFCSTLLCVCVCVFAGLHIHYGNYLWQPEMTPACYVSSELATQEGHGPRSAACIRSHSVYLCVRPCHRHPP